MSEWIKYTGSHEQIDEINASINKHGFVFRYRNNFISQILNVPVRHNKIPGCFIQTHYLICDPHPLADMICQQARTGQPVWIKLPAYMIGGLEEYWNETREYKINIDHYPPVIVTTTPDWNIPDAEYSFTPFEENVSIN